MTKQEDIQFRNEFRETRRQTGFSLKRVGKLFTPKMSIAALYEFEARQSSIRTRREEYENVLEKMKKALESIE